MKKLTDKSKRTLAVAGIGVVCVALIIGIFYRFSAGKVKASGVSSTSPSSSSEVVVAAVGTGRPEFGKRFFPRIILRCIFISVGCVLQ